MKALLLWAMATAWTAGKKHTEAAPKVMREDGSESAICVCDGTGCFVFSGTDRYD